MKKILMLFILMFSLVALSACGNKSDFKHDGKYTAYAGTYGETDVSWVTVTVKDGKIVAYKLDEIKKDATESKRQLLFRYGMVIASKIEKEWFEQADSIEEQWLLEGFDSMTLDTKGYIDNVAGATMKGESYILAAQRAVQAAKDNKHPELPEIIVTIMGRTKS